MSKNPFLNASLAALYIIVVALVMTYGPEGIKDKKETVLIPIAMISLLTFSVAMMGYLFALQPLQLYLDGKKKEAVNLFVKTLATFGAITTVLLTLLFSGVLL